MCTVGGANWSTEKCLTILDKVHLLQVNANFDSLMSGEIEASKKIVLKQRYMEHSSKLYRLTSLSINDQVENHSPHSRQIDDTIVS